MRKASRIFASGYWQLCRGSGSGSGSGSGTRTRTRTGYNSGGSLLRQARSLQLAEKRASRIFARRVPHARMQ